jgi:hypothetical protein
MERDLMYPRASGFPRIVAILLVPFAFLSAGVAFAATGKIPNAGRKLGRADFGRGNFVGTFESAYR